MSQHKILIVEDESIVAKDLQQILEAAKYPKPAIANSAEKALKKIESDTPDLVLMDIVLQGKMDGIELTKHINKMYNIPVVYLTAYTNDGMITRAEETMHHGYIIKPFEEENLVRCVKKTLSTIASSKKKKPALTKLKAAGKSSARLRTDDQCLLYLFKMRFTEIQCLQCERHNAYHRHSQKLCFSCTCGKSHIYPKRGTIFEESRLPLTKWFYAISLMCQFHGDISARELERNLRVTYVTAHRLKKILLTLLSKEEWEQKDVSLESVLPLTITAKSPIR